MMFGEAPRPGIDIGASLPSPDLGRQIRRPQIARRPGDGLENERSRFEQELRVKLVEIGHDFTN